MTDLASRFDSGRGLRDADQRRAKDGAEDYRAWCERYDARRRRNRWLLVVGAFVFAFLAAVAL